MHTRRDTTLGISHTPPVWKGKHPTPRVEGAANLHLVLLVVLLLEQREKEGCLPWATLLPYQLLLAKCDSCQVVPRDRLRCHRECLRASLYNLDVEAKPAA